MDVSQIALTWNHDPAAIAKVIAEELGELEPRLDWAQLLKEYGRLRDGIRALAEDMTKSEDMDELRALVSMVDEFRHGVLGAVEPAVLRLQSLEIERRHNSLSWAGGDS
jgi:hypothetical protein